ncbi:LOW QUALITY PROTEIN: LRRN4 C-terminal-like protein [Plectropomus leopardus]|uniref:LOW QUALITY PROTEIN: LRRN4 C-terminal-like protein n=1 Tax=Plectropomus leopardus TaxID=160734 RepID=UPI001C4A8E5F|nr:LOW QUALITY PROTEIN: LRRN4 C-terminal-like protein [Plectropomus leopardus]
MTAPGSDDYDEEDDDIFGKPSPPPKVVVSGRKTTLYQAPQLCKIDPCMENQEPCEQLSERTRCLCPGVSGADKPPHAPRIQGLLPVSGVDRGKIEIKWCAPSSVVSEYRVVIDGSEVLKFRGISRQGLLKPLEAGTKVCVEAVNNAGQSTPSDFSCKRYEPPESSDIKLLAGVIGGGVALLLLLILGGMIIWMHQMRKKAKKDSTNGLGNPSYSTEGDSVIQISTHNPSWSH